MASTASSSDVKASSILTPNPFTTQNTNDDKCQFMYESAVVPNVWLQMRCQEILAVEKESKTGRKALVVVNMNNKILIVNGKIRTSQLDAFTFDEALVHPALIAHPNPRTVFIVGGSLSTAAQVLRHKTVTKVILVDVGSLLIKIWKKHFPTLCQNAEKDERLSIVYGDPLKLLQEQKHTFDIILVESRFPIQQSSLSYKLYTKQFYALVSRTLSAQGLFVTVAGSASLVQAKQCFTTILNTARQCFQHAVPYSVEDPTACTVFGFVISYNNVHKNNNNNNNNKNNKNNNNSVKAIENKASHTYDFLASAAAHIDVTINARISNVSKAPLEAYDGVAHRGMFAMEKAIRSMIKAETRTITVAKHPCNTMI